MHAQYFLLLRTHSKLNMIYSVSPEQTTPFYALVSQSETKAPTDDSILSLGFCRSLCYLIKDKDLD